jgi:hypothetical protein
LIVQEDAERLGVIDKIANGAKIGQPVMNNYCAPYEKTNLRGKESVNSIPSSNYINPILLKYLKKR